MSIDASLIIWQWSNKGREVDVVSSLAIVFGRGICWGCQLPQASGRWSPTQLAWHLPLPLVLENLKAVEP